MQTTSGSKQPSTSRRVPTRKRAGETIDHVLDVTQAIIAREGLMDLSTNRIAREAGLSVGAIYQYFSNKEGVVAALYQRALDRVWAELTAVSEDLGEKPSLDELLEAARTRIGPADRTEFTPLMMTISNARIPQVMDADRAHATRVASWLADVLERIGANWPRARLERLATFTFAVYTTAIWDAVLALGEEDGDLDSWRDLAIKAVLETAFTQEGDKDRGTTAASPAPG